MFVTGKIEAQAAPIAGSIITDCADENARSRQVMRFINLFGVTPNFLGVGRQAPDLEAAGQLLDQLDVLSRRPQSVQPARSIIIVNVAPRGEKVKQEYTNGTPFCYLKLGQTLIVSTFTGRSLSLLKKLGLASQVQLMDIPTVTAAAVEWGELTTAQAQAINASQFRSLEFAPLAAYWVSQGRDVPAQTVDIPDHDINGLVWTIDNFGNCKTTLLPQDIKFQDGQEHLLADGQPATTFAHLADVPKNASALTIGSSGYADQRFVEVVVQWKDEGLAASDSAASRHGFKVGDKVLKSTMV